MSQTNTPPSVSQSGNYAASITYADRFFLENVRQMNFRRALTQPFHQDMKAVLGEGGRTQSSNTWPFILCTDLSKGKGDQVTIDKLGRKNGVPIKGDVLVTDAAQPMDWQRDAVKIGLFNMPPINAGGLMTEQRSAHNQEVAQMIVASSYMSDLEDNQATVAICGARGYDNSSGWQLPVESSDLTLGGILDNPILPPTLNRYYVCNSTGTPAGQSGVTTFQAISSSNTINLQFFDYLSTALQNSYYPLKGVKMSDDKLGYNIGSGQTPVYIVGVTLEQYNTLKIQAVNTADWNTFVAMTGVRESYMKHPLFDDMQIGRWRNCIFFVYGRPVTFPAGSTTTMYTDSTATTTGAATATVRIQRGFVLGAEAAAIAFGQAPLRVSGRVAKRGGDVTMQRLPFAWHTEVKEGSILFCYAKMMSGQKKIRFPFLVNGVQVPFDAGVAAFDSYQSPNADFSVV